jgi:hypothetical protein
MSTDNRYRTSDFTALNEAVDTQVQRHQELLQLYRSKSNLNRTYIALGIAGVFAIIILSAALAYWIYTKSQPSAIGFNAQSIQQTESLKSIAAQSEVSGDNAISTHSFFTVFHRTVSEDGLTIVTGQKYAAEDFSVPQHQYCYLETVGAAGAASINIASTTYSGDQVMETDDPAVIQYAAFCNFESHEP